MNKIIPLLTSVLLLTITGAKAQDKIFKRDGNLIEAKVKMVGEKSVTYKRFSNPDGPEYTILIKEIDKIVYENGTSDLFGAHEKNVELNGSDKKKVVDRRASFGDNIITVIPGAYTVQVDGSINDVGVGVSYERLLDENGHIGLVLPLLINFASDKDYTNRYNYGPIQVDASHYHSFLFAPGIKLYPAPKSAKCRYSIGGSVFALVGSEPYIIYSDYFNSGGPYQPSDWHYAMFGLTFYNSINVSPSPHVFMEIFLSTSMALSDNRYSDQSASANLFPPIMQFGVKIGTRY